MFDVSVVMLENLKMSGNLTAVREMSWILLKVKEKILSESCLKLFIVSYIQRLKPGEFGSNPESWQPYITALKPPIVFQLCFNDVPCLQFLQFLHVCMQLLLCM